MRKGGRMTSHDAPQARRAFATVAKALVVLYALIDFVLQLLPPHDPQFRRNRERVNRDAERERLILDWDLGYPEDP